MKKREVIKKISFKTPDLELSIIKEFNEIDKPKKKRKVKNGRRK